MVSPAVNSASVTSLALSESGRSAASLRTRAPCNWHCTAKWISARSVSRGKLKSAHSVRPIRAICPLRKSTLRPAWGPAVIWSVSCMDGRHTECAYYLSVERDRSAVEVEHRRAGDFRLGTRGFELPTGRLLDVHAS